MNVCIYMINRIRHIAILFITCILSFNCTYNPLEVSNDQQESFNSVYISIIGDSISAFEGYQVSEIEGYEWQSYKYYYPLGDVRLIDDIWWAKMAKQLSIPLDHINNCSWSGSLITGDALSTTSAFAGCSERRARDLSYNGFNPSIIICFISCNDWAFNVSIGEWDNTVPLIPSNNVDTFREAYALMLDRIKAYYPDAKVFCMTNLVDIKRDRTPGWPSNNGNGVTVEEWNRSIQDVATVFDFQVIDINKCGITYDNLLDYVIDSGLHPNSKGMTLIANMVADELRTSFFAKTD